MKQIFSLTRLFTTIYNNSKLCEDRKKYILKWYYVKPNNHAILGYRENKGRETRISVLQKTNNLHHFGLLFIWKKGGFQSSRARTNSCMLSLDYKTNNNI